MSTERTRESWIDEAAAFILQQIGTADPKHEPFARMTAETLADNQEGPVSEWDDAETVAADEMDCWRD